MEFKLLMEQIYG